SLKNRAEIAGKSRALADAVAEHYPHVWAASLRARRLKGNPYKGLQALGPEDRGRFFGRERELHELSRRLFSARERQGSPVLIVVGAGGSGKSSLVGAGLLPQLENDESRRWRWGKLTPHGEGGDPLAGLAGCLTRAFGWSGPDYVSNKRKILDSLTT